MKFILVFILLLSGRLMAFDYFNSHINYWGKESKKTDPMATEEKSKPPEVEKKDSSSPIGFDWKKQLDPKNEDFF